MSKLFWGCIFIFINFNFHFGGGSLNILPAFVGYILLLKGMKELARESPLFAGVRPFALGMVVYTALLWVGDLLGVLAGSGAFGGVLGVISVVVSLYVTWAIIQGVRDMETRRGLPFNGAAMHQAWLVQVVAQVAAYVLVIFPLVAMVGIIVGLVGNIMLLVAVWRGKKLYENAGRYDGDME